MTTEMCDLLDEQTRLLNSQTKMTDMNVERWQLAGQNGDGAWQR
jgi:hypothetical protein